MMKIRRVHTDFNKNIYLVLPIALSVVVVTGCNTKPQYAFSDYEEIPYTEVQSTDMSKQYQQQDERFIYETSITADLDNRYNAEVYIAENLSIEQVKDIILEQIKSHIETVDTNVEDGCVVIVTDRYYIMIYKSEDNETLIQVSERGYVYNSRNHLYRGPLYARSFYRDYYYYKCYKNDHNRFNTTKNGFDEFTPSTKKLNIITDINQTDNANKATATPKSTDINKATTVPKKVDINKATTVPENNDGSNKVNDNYINKNNNTVKDSNTDNRNSSPRKKSRTTTKKSRKRR